MDRSVTKDAFLNGEVHVFQPAKGFRAGTDSVLLAAALDADATGAALEVGCGSGGALFPAAKRLAGMHFAGLEQDPAAFERAERGRVANRMEGQVELIHGDAARMPGLWENRFDLVFSNPPFFGEGTIKQPGAGKDAAYLESLPLKDWINAMLFALRPKGTFVMIHRAAELARILAVIERQAGEIAVLPVRSYPGSDAKRVIVRARKGLRSGPMRLLAGIDLYQAKGGERTALIEAVTYDGVGLDWGR
jgi:tRNA1(Val) A37 N6-methylase TrmN6